MMTFIVVSLGLIVFFIVIAGAAVSLLVIKALEGWE